MAALSMLVAAASAQTLSSAYFTQDYKFRHDLNAAYGNERAEGGGEEMAAQLQADQSRQQHPCADHADMMDVSFLHPVIDDGRHKKRDGHFHAHFPDHEDRGQDAGDAERDQHRRIHI
mgnify:CR=1 FL=1